MLISPAYAQDAAAGGGGLLVQILPLILIFAIFYFLLIRPQQRKMREHREMLSALKRGDRVITGGGIIGTITKVRDDSDEMEIEIAQGVKVTVVRGTVGSLVKPTAANDEAVKT